MAKRLPCTTRPLGAVLYEGPSELDGSPIVVIVTGLKRGSGNAKTGDMLQTWILRADMDPLQAQKTKQDSAICGDCMHRGSSCYVTVFQAPLAVWRAWKRGRYADWTGAFPVRALEGRKIRLGAYGDPAAVPFRVWRRVFSQRLSGWTGYTHQWRNPRFSRLRGYVMASADSEADAFEAQAQGWRTFRVRHNDDPLLPGELMCPASDEAGKKTTCADCRLCQGQALTAKSVAIVVHGSRAKAFA